MRKLFSLTAACTAIALVGAVCAPSVQAQWGTFKGQLVLDGDIPKIDPLVVKGNSATKDAAVCAAEEVPDEKLVVDAASKGIANVVIYLAKKPAKIHPDLAKSKDKELIFDQKGCRFLPHVMVVRTDQIIKVLSDDAVAHNTHSNPIKNNPENFVVTANDRKGVTMKAMTLAEKTPTKVNCDIHPWMAAYWMIVDHPYAAVTDATGHFEIPNLPAGKHDFVVWQEASGYLEKKLEVNIKDGATEEKTLKFKASQILK